MFEGSTGEVEKNVCSPRLEEELVLVLVIVCILDCSLESVRRGLLRRLDNVESSSVTQVSEVSLVLLCCLFFSSRKD